LIAVDCGLAASVGSSHCHFVGGSWEFGSASFLLYNPDADISLVEDVIVVTVNYRLNVFGFLGSTALRNQVATFDVVVFVMLHDVMEMV
jgi:carboxylesterase type B